MIDQTDHLDHLENTEVILCFSHLSMYLQSVYKDFEGERYCISYAGIAQKMKVFRVKGAKLGILKNVPTSVRGNMEIPYYTIIKRCIL